MATEIGITALVQERIKTQQSQERIKTGVTLLQWDDTFPQKVLFILAPLLKEGSSDHFVNQVASLCNGSTSEEYNLKSLKQDYPKNAFEAFHREWKKLGIGRQQECEAYLAYKKTYGPALQTHVSVHEKVVQSLFCILRTKQEVSLLTSILTKLLALSYWLHRFYEEKFQKHHRDYNKHLHYFIKDLIITFLALRCQFPCQPAKCTPPVAVFKKFLLCKQITPENDAYLLLILKRMLQIILPKDTSCEPESIKLAAKVHENMKCFPGWRREGANGVLTVVKDQSRYLSITSPALRRNFVAYKTRNQIADTVLRIEKTNIDSIKRQAEEETNAKKMTVKKLANFKKLLDFMGKLNPLDWFDIKGQVEEDEEDVLNLLHHCILVDIAETIDPDGIPKYNSRRWFLDETGNRINIIPFIHKLAAQVIQEGKDSLRTTTILPKCQKKRLCTLVVALQRIIAARWYLCGAYHRGKTPDSKEVQNHEEILFTMIAFRALLLLMLPKRPPSGVQRVAECLPNYAREFKLDVHLMVFS